MERAPLCDSCGAEIGGDQSWQIGLKLDSMWRQNGGHTVVLKLCSKCGHQAARLLGFCYDTGTILSVARRGMIDGAEVHGPNGGGLEDIAFNGVGGGHGIRWHEGSPNELPARCMVREEAPWMRAQGYEEKFWRTQAAELMDADLRRMVEEGASDSEISMRKWGFANVDPDDFNGKSRLEGVRSIREKYREATKRLRETK